MPEARSPIMESVVKISDLVLNSNFKVSRMKTVGIITCLMSVFLAFGQTQRMSESEAEELFARKHYSAVWEYYRDKLKFDSLNPVLNYKMGICYLNSRSQKNNAIPCFNRVISSGNENILSGELYKLLADAFYASFDYDRAMVNYQKYQKVLSERKEKSKYEMEEVDLKLELCAKNKEIRELKELSCTLMKHKCNVKNNNYRSLLNSSANIYAEAIKKPLSLEKTLHSDDLFENNVMTIPSNTSTLQRSDSTNGMMETTVATSEDGQIILIYRNEGGIANLYVSRLIGNDWVLPEKLSRTVNDNGWETGEVLSLDGNTLYFTSDKEGGYGGKDIYRCVRLQNGEWGRAVNLGPSINSPFDEEAPFIHPDGTLYFSSNRYKTKGGYNNYKSAWCDSCGSWSMAEDVSYPLYKHNRNLSKGKVEDDVDNYRVNLLNARKLPVTMIKGKLMTRDEKLFKYAEITVTDNETGRLLGVYYPDNTSGKYIFTLPPGKDLNITYQADGYLFRSENLQTNKEASFYRSARSIGLDVLEEGAMTILNNVFFEEGKAELKPQSEVELNRLYELLIDHPKLGIELYTLPNKENKDSRLSEERIDAVMKYLSDKGIGKERMASKLWRKVEKKKHRRRKVVESITEDSTEKVGLKIVTL
jgi:outer membrane protein OmpA-like peptidoglycan-associated protein